MKRIILFLAAAWALYSCSVDNDYIFDDISTYRLNQLIKECDSTLRKSEHGWLFNYAPDSANYGIFTFWVDFDANYRVTMESDFFNSYLPETSEGSYGYSVSVGPALGFETYNLIHLLNDPNPSIAGGRMGQGYNGDFEFLLRTVSDDTIKLLGKKSGRPAELIRAKAGDRETLKQRKAMMESIKVDPTKPFYNYLNIGSDTAFFYFSPSLRMAYLVHPDGNQTIIQRSRVYSSVEGISLEQPFTLGGKAFSNIAFHASEYQYSIQDAGVNGTFFRTASITDGCLLRFPGAIKTAKKYGDGFAMVEEGDGLHSDSKYNLFPSRLASALAVSTGVIEEFRFFWSIVGYGGAGPMVNEVVEGGNCGYIGLYEESIMDTVIGDRIKYLEINDRFHLGIPNSTTDQAFGSPYKGGGDETNDGGILVTAGPLSRYMCYSKGHQVIPAGRQFFLIHNDNNSRWALYTPVRRDW